LMKSYEVNSDLTKKPETVAEYVAQVPAVAHARLHELRELVLDELPGAEEVLSYGIIGYKVDGRRAPVFVSGWEGHVALYPVPKSQELVQELKPYIRGK